MNMSGQYTSYYQLFGPPLQVYEPPDPGPPRHNQSETPPERPLEWPTDRPPDPPCYIRQPQRIQPETPPERPPDAVNYLRQPRLNQPEAPLERLPDAPSYLRQPQRIQPEAPPERPPDAANYLRQPRHNQPEAPLERLPDAPSYLRQPQRIQPEAPPERPPDAANYLRQPRHNQPEAPLERLPDAPSYLRQPQRIQPEAPPERPPDAANYLRQPRHNQPEAPLERLPDAPSYLRQPQRIQPEAPPERPPDAVNYLRQPRPNQPEAPLERLPDAQSYLRQPRCNQPEAPPDRPLDPPIYSRQARCNQLEAPPEAPDPPSYSRQPPYAEYSLWGTSSYNPVQPVLINHGIDEVCVFGSQRPCPFPSNVQFYHVLEHHKHHEEPPPVPSVPPDAVTQTEDEFRQLKPVTSSEEPELTGLEIPEKIVVDRAVLYKLPDDIDDSDIDEIDPDAVDVEQASNSSGSSAGDWTHSYFQRPGAFPSVYPWASRPARVVNNRGKKANIMQRRLVRALSQPVKMDKGASIMQRMGWLGGGLGPTEDGITDPIKPNAVYAASTVGFGKDAVKPVRASKRVNCSTRPRKILCKKTKKEYFKTNVLQCILDFVKNDRMLELYFDTELLSWERKRIHRLVAVLDERDKAVEKDTMYQEKIVKNILNRNRYMLTTQSEGDGPTRQICLFKVAPSFMFLVTPDDCRPCITEIKEIEEEPNPFLKSIAKHIRKDEGTILKPKAPFLFDKLVEFFVDFCAEDRYLEFRFLGPFTNKEVYVINNFLTLVNHLTKKQRPDFRCPVELLDAFTTNHKFQVEKDPNGFISIKKAEYNLKLEYEKERKEKRKNRVKRTW